MQLLSLFIFPSLLAVAAQASQLTIQSPRFTVISNGTQIRSEPYADAPHAPPTCADYDSFFHSLSLAGTPEQPVALGSSDVLKLTFTVAEKENDKGVQPHQTFLRFYDETTGEEGIQPIRVSAAGKAKFELVRTRVSSSGVALSLTIPFACTEHGTSADIAAPYG